MQRLARASGRRSPEEAGHSGISESPEVPTPRSSHPNGRTYVDRFIGLDAHGSSYAPGVVTPRSMGVAPQGAEALARCLMEHAKRHCPRITAWPRWACSKLHVREP